MDTNVWVRRGRDGKMLFSFFSDHHLDKEEEQALIRNWKLQQIKKKMKKHLVESKK